MIILQLIWTVETPSDWLLYSSDTSPSILSIPYHQAHLVSFLSQAPFRGALVPFSGRWYLEMKMLVLGVLMAVRMLLLLEHSVHLGSVRLRLSLCSCLCVCLLM